MAQVKLTTSLVGAQALNAGDIHECSDAEAKRLIAAGFAVAIAAPKKETAVAKKHVETR